MAERKGILQQVESRRQGEKLVPQLQRAFADFLQRHVPSPSIEGVAEIQQWKYNGILYGYPHNEKGHWDYRSWVSRTRVECQIPLESGVLEFVLSSSAYPHPDSEIEAIDFNLEIKELDSLLEVIPQSTGNGKTHIESLTRKTGDLRHVPVGSRLSSWPEWTRSFTKEDYDAYLELLDWAEEEGEFTPKSHQTLRTDY